MQKIIANLALVAATDAHDGQSDKQAQPFLVYLRHVPEVVQQQTEGCETSSVWEADCTPVHCADMAFSPVGLEDRQQERHQVVGTAAVQLAGAQHTAKVAAVVTPVQDYKLSIAVVSHNTPDSSGLASKSPWQVMQPRRQPFVCRRQGTGPALSEQRWRRRCRHQRRRETWWSTKTTSRHGDPAGASPCCCCPCSPHRRSESLCWPSPLSLGTPRWIGNENDWPPCTLASLIHHNGRPPHNLPAAKSLPIRRTLAKSWCER